MELHTGYKCRVRLPWYTVPSVYAHELGMLKRAHNSPRLILNKICAYTTDTAYRIRVLRTLFSGVSPEKLVGCFINPLTALSAEVEGRHYGGCVLGPIPYGIDPRLGTPPAKGAIAPVELDESIPNEPKP